MAIVSFDGITKLDLPPDKVLDAAIGKLDCVVIVGIDKLGRLYFAGSQADRAQTLWHLERAKHKLLKIADE